MPLKNQKHIIAKLSEALDSDTVSTDEANKKKYGLDSTQDNTANPLAIIFPRSTQDVITTVKLANDLKISLVPSGGRTGYSGAAVATHQEVVVSFDRMNNVLNFDEEDKQVTCEAGVTTKTIQNIAKENNLYYPIDYAAANHSHIGGNIATNAGGIHVIRYGSTRSWVAGLKVVTGNGDLLELNHGLIKNSSGYDLRHLFIGSEGTLGFITQATIQLCSQPKKTKTIFMSINDKYHLIKILNTLQQNVLIHAFEFFDDASMQHVTSYANLTSPFKTTQPAYILLDYESNSESDHNMTTALQYCKNKGWLADNILASNEEEAHKLWRFRIDISRSLTQHKPYKYDIAVRPSQIANFMHQCNDTFKSVYPNLETAWWGHVGDGNLHLNILKPDTLSTEEFFNYCHKASKTVYELIKKFNGTVSAEHGIGLLKKDFLGYCKSEKEISYMEKIKKIFDENGIMNPGKLL